MVEPEEYTQEAGSVLSGLQGEEWSDVDISHGTRRKLRMKKIIQLD